MKLSHSSRFWAVATASAVWMLAAAAESVTAEDCNVGEQQLEFTFFLDEDSTTENGWTLACDGGEGAIWNVPIGSIQSTDGFVQSQPQEDQPEDATPFVKEQVCIPESLTCHFTLEDSFGDGLLFPGYYYLTYGATTIAVSEEGEEFLEKSYCVGPNCPILAQEVAEQCDEVFLVFQANLDTPEQSSVEITCNDGAILFSKSDFTTPGEAVEFEYCLPIDQCCTLTVVSNSAGQGGGGDGGEVFAEWANQVILSHDESNASDLGTTVSTNFGLACPTVSTADPVLPGEEVVSPQIEDGEEDFTEPDQDEDEDVIDEPAPPSVPTKDWSEQVDSIEQSMVNEDDMDDMSSTIQIGLMLLITLLVLGLSALFISRCYYSSTSSAAAVRGASSTPSSLVDDGRGGGNNNKDLETRSVSSSSSDTVLADDL